MAADTIASPSKLLLVVWRILVVAVASIAILSAAVAVRAAGSQQPVASGIAIMPIAPINPVSGADGDIHLVYELLLVNQSAYLVEVESVAVLDGVSGKILKELEGASLASVTRLNMFGGTGSLLQPSQSAFIFFDVAISTESALPASVQHKITTRQMLPEKEVTAELGGLAVKPDSGIVPNATFVSAPLPVDGTPEIVLSPPVRGGNWIIFRGCCDVSTSHRGGTGAYDGTIYVPERFAIDFVQISDDGRLLTGPGNELASYVHYGVPVFAVADGIVISARNAEPDQIPGIFPDGIMADMAGGNAVLVDIGGGRFAFFAHMKPGSVRVKTGDRIKSGDVIGLIGNSGKTFGPHLHFHLVDRASPIAANGLPYGFKAFTGQGVMSGDALMLALQGQPAPVDRNMLAGSHVNQHPLNNQVVDFGR